jgi:hypothetical protein
VAPTIVRDHGRIVGNPDTILEPSLRDRSPAWGAIADHFTFPYGKKTAHRCLRHDGPGSNDAGYDFRLQLASAIVNYKRFSLAGLALVPDGVSPHGVTETSGISRYSLRGRPSRKVPAGTSQ